MRRFHMSRIRAYKMTHATGFAPNPFDGCMTLACCKPLMRNGKAVEKDDWIIGVGTKALGSGDINNPDEAKYENKIIYVMKVQKLVPWTEYYSTCIENGLSSKLSQSGDIDRDICGDCIYRWNGERKPEEITRSMQEEFADYVSQFKFKPNIYHTDISSPVHDLGGKYVIFGDPENSYYLGNDAVQIELDTNPFEKINRAPYGIVINEKELDICNLIKQLKRKGIKPLKEETPETLKKRIIKPKESFDSDGNAKPVKDKKTNQELEPETIIKAMPESISRDEVMRELNKNKIKRNPAEPLIILSRKGFDTACGRCPSLIINGKQMISFPIPEDSKQNDCKVFPTYSNLKIVIDNVGEKSLKNLILGSTGRAKKTIFKDMELDKEDNGDNEPRCHFDPQLFNYHKASDFVASLGQMGIAARLLNKYDVKEGDLFLFFGNFKFVNDKLEPVPHKIEGKYEVPKNEFLHCIWGYMEIGKVIANPQNKKVPSYIKNHHPHMKYESPENFLYIAADELSDKWCPSGYAKKMKGYGVFDFDDKLVLSPTNDKFVKHKDYWRNKWTILPLYVNNDLKTQIPVRGQEFVLFPNSIPDGKNNITPECIENYNDFKEKIKEVIKKQAGKFLIS